MKLQTLLCLLAIALFAACAGNRRDITPSAEFAPYVNAYTGGVISSQGTIRIELAQDLPVVDLNELKETPFSFSPALDGKAHWLDNHTIEFVPDEGALQSGELYNGVFRLGDFVAVKEGLEEFRFSFRVQPRTFTMQAETPVITSADYLSLAGEIRFSDAVTTTEAEEMLSVGRKGVVIRVTPTDNALRYAFTLDSIPREKEDYTLTLTADGEPAGIDQKQRLDFTIPARGVFRFLSARRTDTPENGLEIVFSAPLDASQDLKGLVEIKEAPKAIFQVKANKLHVYLDETQKTDGKLTLNLHEGIRDAEGRKLGAAHSLSFGELHIKPQVELRTEAAILPDSKSLLIPFRAVNLHAVDLSVVRIFEQNVLTFLQTNTPESANELRRAGRLVYKKTLPLDEDQTKDIHQWNDYSIDLGGLIRQEPGAIYRIYLSFRQEYSAYPCEGQAPQPSFSADRLTPLADNALTEADEAEWDVPQSYFYYNGGVEYDWSLYDWREQDNPCHPSYYMNSSRVAACNVYASNLGLIVKGNTMHRIWIAVSDILTTRPVEGADITVYNFQLQPIGTGKTDSEGFAEISPDGVPFLVCASDGKQKGYLRVVAGENLSTSRFDTGGKQIEKGLKGFIYGERGVWRPGDTLHVSFILEDREKRIPDTHPVTLEVYNPRGQFHSKLVSTRGLNGFHAFQVPTRADDPTGVWNAYVKVGGSTFHKSLRIESVKPNRLKINVKLPEKMLQASRKEVQATISSAWLTGATASRLKTKMEMSLSKVNTQFPKYGQYVFNNPATEFTTQKAEVFDGQLDADGKAAFSLKLPQASTAPGMLNATLTTRVFEPGGDASIHVQSIPYSPFTSYVGIALNQPEGKSIETDQAHRFDIVTLTPDGKPTDRSRLEYKIYRVDWSWWWENREESFGTYVNNSSVTPVAGGNLETKNGKASFTFRVDYPDWGRYLVYVKDKESGHATGGTVYIDWPEWRGRSTKADPDNVKMLTFSLDKESYKPGDKGTAFIPAAAGGHALVAIENGSTVLKREWIETDAEEDTRYTFNITPDMAPNVYLHVTLLQPHAQTVNDLPIRMYGVAPVLVTDPATVLQPRIEMPDALRPESDFSIIVSEKTGKPMTYTLAIVDEGLLDLTNFRTPDPWQEFYAREALGIATWDMYDQVLGASAGRYAPIFGTGGDEMLKPADAKANRFKPVVKFIGPFHIDKGKRGIHTLRLPQYVGSVRVMLIAGEDGSYGHAEKTVPVRTPLMLLPTLPRVLSTGEEIQVPVNVFAMEQGAKDVSVSIQAEGAGIAIEGPSQQSLRFDQPGDQLVCFRMKTSPKTGKATIRFTASGGGRQVKESVEIDVRNPNPTVTLRESRWIEPGKQAELAYAATGEDASVQLEMSRIPSPDLSRRLDFLYNYAHACTEQITSKALPLLFLDAFGETDTEASASSTANVREGIRQLYARQLPNGGFAYWPTQAVADEWVTSYAGMFLTLAAEKGYAVHANTLEKWKRFQRSAAQNWRLSDYADKYRQETACLQQAFRLYTLALAGAPEPGAMNRMKEQDNLPAQARWRLAAAYALTGKPDAANELIFNAPSHSSTSTMTLYGSPLRDEAMALETLVLLNRTDEALEQAKAVSQSLQEETGFSTQSTAFALMAMARLAEKTSGSLHYGWTLNGKTQAEVASGKATRIHTLPASGKGSVHVENLGEGTLNMTLITRMQPVEDNLPEQARGIRLQVAYTDMNGKPLSVNALRQGTDFMATVTVENTSAKDLAHLALTHILPAGWEIFNERLDDTQANANYAYQDVRDDRVLTYFDLKRGERKPFVVRLQATYAGQFILPALQCEAMYDTAIQARTRAGRTTVTP